MNLDTVLMCAQTTARQQLAALGFVADDVQALIDELTPAPVAEEPAAEAEVQQVAPEEQAVAADEQPAE